MGKLANKVAVVTGASKGIGAAIAKSLAAQGAAVVVNYASSQAGADRVVQTILSAGGRAAAVRGDVSKKADVDAVVDAAIENFGKLDIVVNNSGVYEFAGIQDVTEESFHRLFNINVLGPLLITRAAARHLGEGASVINIGSGISSVTPPNSSVYAGTKGALDVITRVLAKELGPRKIRVNSINPGFVITEGTEGAGITGSELIALTPLGRAGQPSDIASVATFLASDDAAWVTGELLLVGGGLR